MPRPEESPKALTGGVWRLRGNVLAWVPTEPVRGEPRSVAGLTACPTCHARVDQLCRTRTGRHRVPHANRLVAKRCQCGSRLGYNKKLCEECRVQARRETWRLTKQQNRAGKAAA